MGSRGSGSASMRTAATTFAPRRWRLPLVAIAAALIGLLGAGTAPRRRSAAEVAEGIRSASGGQDIRLLSCRTGCCPSPNRFKVDPDTGFVRDTHGVSVFDNPGNVSRRRFTPHEVDQSTIPSQLRIIQRGHDPSHYEIVPRPGANLTPDKFATCLAAIGCR